MDKKYELIEELIRTTKQLERIRREFTREERAVSYRIEAAYSDIKTLPSGCGEDLLKAFAAVAEGQIEILTKQLEGLVK